MRKSKLLYISYFLICSNIFASPNDDLLTAVQNGDVSGVQKALEQKADINTKNSKGETPLMLASGRGNEQLVKLLLLKGANIHVIDDDGYSALSHALLYELCESSNVSSILEKAGVRKSEIDDDLAKSGCK